MRAGLLWSLALAAVVKFEACDSVGRAPASLLSPLRPLAPRELDPLRLDDMVSRIAERFFAPRGLVLVISERIDDARAASSVLRASR